MAVPNLFGTGDSFIEDTFSMVGSVGDGFMMIEVHYTYCALYFYFYYYIRSSSDHQALDPGDLGPLL